MKKERFTRWLPVVLTEHEILERSRTMSERCKEKAALEARKAAAVREFGEQLKKLSGEISRLSEIVSSGREQRTDECQEQYDAGKILEVRLDTGEVVSSRLATDEERQAGIFG